MSQENEEIARRFLISLGQGDYDGAVACLHDDAVWTNTAAFPGARTITGPKAIIDFWKNLVESFDQANDGLEIETIMGSRHRVVAGVRTRGRAVGSGIPVDVRWGLGFLFRGDRIERVQISGDYPGALKAAGMSE